MVAVVVVFAIIASFIVIVIVLRFLARVLPHVIAIVDLSLLFAIL